MQRGNTISPGTWLSQCGLLTVSPYCENAFLHVNQKGIVTHYNHQKQITWTMEGGVCTPSQPECTPGLQIDAEGKITIGGKAVNYVTSYVKEAQLAPWPFSEAPKLKVWRK